MTLNQIILPCAFIALAIVFRLGGVVDIEHIAYAQSWDFASNIHNNQNVDNLLVNGTVFKNSKISTSSNNCMSVSSGPGGNAAISGSAGRTVAISPDASSHITVSNFSSSKTSSNCHTQDMDNSCPRADVLEYQNIIRATSEHPPPPPAGSETFPGKYISGQCVTRLGQETALVSQVFILESEDLELNRHNHRFYASNRETFYPFCCLHF